METPLTQQWDARLRDAIRAGSGRITVPTEAAARIVNLVEAAAVLGQGENYPV
jgi:hypothetical protein